MLITPTERTLIRSKTIKRPLSIVATLSGRHAGLVPALSTFHSLRRPNSFTVRLTTGYLLKLTFSSSALSRKISGEVSNFSIVRADGFEDEDGGSSSQRNPQLDTSSRYICFDFHGIPTSAVCFGQSRWKIHVFL